MKIALVHYSSPPIVGGVESVVAHHARQITKAGHQVTILAGRGQTFDERIPVRLLPFLDSRHEDVLRIKTQLDKGIKPQEFDNLREKIKKELLVDLKDTDVLIAHNIASLHKNLPLTGALHDAYKIAGFPHLILWHHDLAWTTPRYRHEMHAGYPWDLLRDRWEGSTHVVISEVRRQEYMDLTGISRDCIHVIPNGVDVPTFFKLEQQTIQLIDRYKLIESNPLFLLPVRLTPRKNIELALRVMVELHKEFPKTKLLVTGPEGPHNPNNRTYKQKLVSLRNELGLQNSAIFLAELETGFMPDSVIADFYRLADALILPSREEGFGIPIIEAGFSAMPVFCANIPVLRELGGDDVSFFDPDADPGIIAEMIAKRLKNEATSRWSRHAKQHYSWDLVYSRCIKKLLDEVMK